MLSEKLLEKLSEFAIDMDLPTSISTETADWVITTEAERMERMSCRLNAVTLHRRGEAPANLTVRSWAERIAKSVSGLRENLRVVEVDDPAAAALLRSVSPSKKGSVASYYEVRLEGTGTASVKRYEADTKAGTPRVDVPFTLTHEVLGKLVDDIAE
jgi:hypothetical protein